MNSIKSTEEKLKEWISQDESLGRGVHFAWVGQTYRSGVGLVTFTQQDEVVAFDFYSLHDIPIFKRSYARSAFFMKNTIKQKCLERVLERLENATDSDEARDQFMRTCGGFLDHMLQVQA